MALLATAGTAAALVCSCSTPPAASITPDTGVKISLNTPAGLRAKQTVDMLNSDWPIGSNGVATLAAPDKARSVQSTMENLWWDRPFTVSGIDYFAGRATLHLVNSFGAAQDIDIRTDEKGMVEQFDAELKQPPISSWPDVDAALGKSHAHYSYQVAKIVDGRCEKVAGTNTSESLPLASIFKLYVLYAVADAVKAGTLSWDDQLTITARAKDVGSSGLEELPPGANVSVRKAAEKMIANSDNMATDLLIGRVGTAAVERALKQAGHHDPASMTPFPTMHEMFAVGWGKPDMREQWKAAVAAGSAQQRGQLLAQTNSRPYQPDPERTHTPASPYGAEWYGSAEDICRVHAALQTGATGAASPVRQIMSAIPGIDLDTTRWPYIGAKAGNLPGDLTFSWYAVDRQGQPWVVSFQLTWPRFHGPSAGAWMISIAKQVFGMLH
ncbi:MAG TPA: serine hydrolase [Mycobacterium sp.]|nr:serine hydrolase [Mycobacterium sp.]